MGSIGYLLYLLLRPGGWGHPVSREFWIGCGVVLITTSLGKAIGVLAARRKLRQIIREIQAEWKPQRPQERDSGTVGPVSMNLPRPCCGVSMPSITARSAWTGWRPTASTRSMASFRDVASVFFDASADADMNATDVSETSCAAFAS